jgi:single-stranded DNA-binding protein
MRVALGASSWGDPEQRQAWNNGSNFTVLFVATQRSLKNTEDEWVSKVEWHRVAIMWNQVKRTVLAVCEKCELSRMMALVGTSGSVHSGNKWTLRSG